MRAPVWDAAPPAVGHDDSDDGEGGAGGGAASGSDETEQAARRTATLRALRMQAQSRRAARISEHMRGSGGEGAQPHAHAQPHSAHNQHAHAPPLPSAEELAARIARLDVNLQRYMASLLTQLEESQAVVAPALARAGSGSGSGGAGLDAPHRSGSGGGARAVTFAMPRSPPVPPPRPAAAADDLFSDEGGPCGDAAPPPPGFEGGYGSPGERDTSATEELSDCPVLRPRSGPRTVRRPQRFSLAGVPGEAPLGATGWLQPPAGSSASGTPCSPQDAPEPDDGGYESPQQLGASAARLALRRMSHGHPGGLVPGVPTALAGIR
jgi:hypothetical protein